MATTIATIDILPVELKIMILKNLSDYDISSLAGSMSEFFLDIVVEHFPTRLNIRQVIFSYIRARDNSFTLNCESALIKILPKCKYLKHMFAINNYDMEMFRLNFGVVRNLQLCCFERDLMEIIHSRQSLDNICALIADLKLLTNTECFVGNEILFNFAVSSALIDFNIYSEKMIDDLCILASHQMLPKSPITHLIVEILNDVTADVHLPVEAIVSAYIGPSEAILYGFCERIREYIQTMADCNVTKNIVTILTFMVVFGWKDAVYTNNRCTCCLSINIFIDSLLLKVYNMHGLQQMYMTEIYKYVNSVCGFTRGHFGNMSNLPYLK